MTIPIIERLRLFASICQGVGHAHENGVIHRDLKPDNIFLRQDRRTPVVGDFGICFIDDDGERVTMIDEAAGPRWFIAPELDDGRAATIKPTSDVYSLGKLLYWIVGGKKFTREKHREPEYDLTKESQDAAIMFIYDILDKTIKLDPSKRLVDAHAFANEVNLIIRRLLMNAHPINIDAQQHCTYCGIGTYNVLANKDDKKDDYKDIISRFFGSGHTLPDWLVFLCDSCGNVQLFRPELLSNEKKDIWDRNANASTENQRSADER
jgi:serine/threonine protein kinase